MKHNTYREGSTYETATMAVFSSTRRYINNHISTCNQSSVMQSTASDSREWFSGVRKSFRSFWNEVLVLELPGGPQGVRRRHATKRSPPIANVLPPPSLGQRGQAADAAVEGLLTAWPTTRCATPGWNDIEGGPRGKRRLVEHHQSRTTTKTTVPSALASTQPQKTINSYPVYYYEAP